MRLSLTLALVASALALPEPRSRLEARGSETNATLYAYGTNSSGWPIVYGNSDGLLYITEVADESSTSLVPITWDIASITSENWVMNGTFANGTEAGSLYILDADNKYIGVANTTTATATATTSTSAAASTSSSAPEHLVTGFALFATQLVYNNNTSLEAQFWACPTDDDDVHAIVWIPDGESATSGSFPLVIKASED